MFIKLAVTFLDPSGGCFIQKIQLHVYTNIINKTFFVEYFIYLQKLVQRVNAMKLAVSKLDLYGLKFDVQL